mmetsp:Transcript_22221/g.29237  ORF Transcript_22221/g.29237 Transcript_22221/m.29237 type:complete len:246 (+) Transcript_22221:2-739(+)
MNRAINYNNCGLDCMEAGNFDKAIHKFRKAVDSVLHASQEGYTLSDDEEVQECNKLFRTDESKSLLFHTLQDAGVFSNPLTSVGKMLNTPYSSFVYQHAFSLQSLGRTEETNGIQDSGKFQLESTAILYNLGLAYQLKHMEDKDGGNTLQTTAVKLYHHAIDLTLSIEPTTQEEAAFMAYLQICSLNNMGALFHEMGYYNNSSECMRDMNALVSNFPLSEYSCVEWDFFIINFITLVEPCSALAA